MRREGRPRRKSGTGKHRKRWRRLLRWACRIAFVMVSGAALVVVGLPYITDSAPVRSIVADRISQALGGASVRLDGLRLAPLDGRLLVMSGLTIAPPDRPDEPVLSLERVECLWNPWALPGRKVHVTGVRLSGVSLRLVEQGGVWNVASLAPSTGLDEHDGEGAFDLASLRLPGKVILDNIRFEGLRAELISESFGRLTVGPVSGTARVELDEDLMGGLEVRWRLEEVAAGLDRPVAAEVAASMHGSVHIERTDADSLSWNASLSVRDLRAGLSGAELPMPPSIECTAHGTVDLADLGRADVKARLEVPGLLADTLSLSVTPGDGWQIDAENRIAIELEGADALVRAALPYLADLPSVAERVNLATVRELRGRVEATSTAHVLVRPGPPTVANATITNRLSARGVGLEMDLGLTPSAGAAPLRLQGGIEAADVDWNYEAQVDIADGLTLHSEEELSAKAGLLRLDAKGLGGFALSDLAVKVSAADDIEFAPGGGAEVPNVDISLSIEAQGEALALSSPLFGEVAVPVSISAEIAGTNLADLEAATISLGKFSGSAGAVLPKLAIKGILQGYGMKSVELEGAAAADLGPLVGLKEGLNAELRELIAGLSAEGRIEAAFTLAGALPRDGADAELALRLSGKATVPSASFVQGDLVLGVHDAEAEYEADLALPADYLPRDVGWAGSVRVGPVEMAAAGAAVALDGMEANASGRIGLLYGGALPLEKLSCALEAEAAGLAITLPPSAEGGAATLEPVDVRAAGELQADLGRGDVVLLNASLTVPGLLTVSGAEARLEQFGVRSVDARGVVEVPELANILLLAPEELLQRLPQLSGSAKWKVVDLGGRVPGVARIVEAIRAGAAAPELAANLVSSLRTGEPWPELRLFPLERFHREAAPLTLSTTLAVRDFTFEHQIDEDIAAGLDGVSADFALEVQDGKIEARANVSIPVAWATPLSMPLEDLSCAASVTFDDFDRLTVSDARAGALGGVVTADAAANVSGLGAFFAARPGLSPAAIAGALDIVADVSCKVDPEAISMLEGWEGGGAAGASFGLVLEAGRNLELSGLVRLDNLTVAAADLFRVDGLSASVPVAKRWRLLTRRQVPLSPTLSDEVAGARSPAEPGAAWMQQGMAPAITQLLEPEDDLTLRSVSVLGRTLVEELSLCVRLEPDSFRVPRAHMRVLGGQVIGRTAAWTEEGGVRLFLEGEFDRLDVRRMLPPELRDFRGDSSVSGTARAELALRNFMDAVEPADGSAPVRTRNPFRDVRGLLDVTHIGPEALRRATLVVDPRAENPSFVQLRRALALASPRSVRLRSRAGFVEGEVQLQGLFGRLLRSYPVPRLSITEAFGLERAGEYFGLLSQAVDAARLPLEALAAEQIVLSEDGWEITFLP